MDAGDFRRWWLEDHALKVKQWPGLKRYCVNLSTTDDQRYDGVAEVWFESEAAMDAVFDTSIGAAARSNAMDGSQEIVILMTEEHVMVDG